MNIENTPTTMHHVYTECISFTTVTATFTTSGSKADNTCIGFHYDCRFFHPHYRSIQPHRALTLQTLTCTAIGHLRQRMKCSECGGPSLWPNLWVCVRVRACVRQLTAGWSYPRGWPWAGSSCPSLTGWTRPRRSTASPRWPGWEAGITSGPHGSTGTSSGTWREAGLWNVPRWRENHRMTQWNAKWVSTFNWKSWRGEMRNLAKYDSTSTHCMQMSLPWVYGPMKMF